MTWCLRQLQRNGSRKRRGTGRAISQPVVFLRRAPPEDAEQRGRSGVEQVVEDKGGQVAAKIRPVVSMHERASVEEAGIAWWTL